MDNHEHEYVTIWDIEVTDDSRMQDGVVVFQKVGSPKRFCRVCEKVCEDCIPVGDGKAAG